MLDPRSTLRRVYTTPRGVTPAFVLVLCSIVVVSKVQKQSVSNAFQYVVLRPVAPSPSDDIPAARGQMQVQNYKIISEYHRIRQLFKLFLTLCAAEESSLLRKENGTGWERT